MRHERKRGGLEPPPPVGGNKLQILVVGGGVSGVMSAFELARAGHEVTIIENQTIGSGSSQRSAACIRQQFGTPSTVRGMVYATRFFENWEMIMNSHGDPLVQAGYLFLKDWNSNPVKVAELVQMQKEAGLTEVEFLTIQEIERRFPYINTAGLLSATWCPTDGFLLPHIIYNDGAEACRALGVKIFQHTQIVRVGWNTAGDISLVETTAGTFRPDLVVNCTNAWCQSVSRTLGGMVLPVKPTKRYLYHGPGPGEEWAESPEEFAHAPMIVGPNDCYGHPSENGKAWMMGWLHGTNGGVNPVTVDQDEIESGFGTGNLANYGAALFYETSRWAPGVIRRVERVTSGFYCETPDHNPIIDYDPRVSNLIHAIGYSGHGLMHSPFTGRIVAELVANGCSTEEMEMPWDIGEVDLRAYWATRDFSHAEGMQI